MRISFWLVIIIVSTSCIRFPNNEREWEWEETNLPPLEQAYFNYKDRLKAELKEIGIQPSNLKLFLRAFKQEELLEVWVRPTTSSTFQLFKTYPFCTSSGTLGPKRQEGDRQIPEGFYQADWLNPKSQFHLSIHINYPNPSDQILGVQGRLGGDIFIHGDCQTIGCIPITDEKIEELYVLLDWHRSYQNEGTTVHIFPFHLTDQKLKKFSRAFPQHQQFWESLQKGYAYFEKHKQVSLYLTQVAYRERKEG